MKPTPTKIKRKVKVNCRLTAINVNANASRAAVFVGRATFPITRFILQNRFNLIAERIVLKYKWLNFKMVYQCVILRGFIGYINIYIFVVRCAWRACFYRRRAVLSGCKLIIAFWMTMATSKKLYILHSFYIMYAVGGQVLNQRKSCCSDIV